MNEKTRTMEERLFEGGIWNKEDGTFANTGHSLAVLLIRMNRRLANGVRLDFHHYIKGQPECEAWLKWDEQEQALGIGQTLAGAICNAALALPEFLKDHPECARHLNGAGLETT